MTNQSACRMSNNQDIRRIYRCNRNASVTIQSNNVIGTANGTEGVVVAFCNCAAYRIHSRLPARTGSIRFGRRSCGAIIQCAYTSC